jgi:hypothetical protein
MSDVLGDACRPDESVWGRVACSPVISREKKMPIEMACPLFINVARIPDACPR